MHYQFYIFLFRNMTELKLLRGLELSLYLEYFIWIYLI